jgi:hypothetical protein
MSQMFPRLVRTCGGGFGITIESKCPRQGHRGNRRVWSLPESLSKRSDGIGPV